MTTSVTRSYQTLRSITGSSISSGRLVTESTAVCTSSPARAMSQPGSNSRRITARPSNEVLVVPSTPGTARSAGSSTWTIPASTSSAPAFSHTVFTVTLSRMTSGKNCARMLGMATRPDSSSRTSSRFATVPWRVK